MFKFMATAPKSETCWQLCFFLSLLEKRSHTYTVTFTPPSKQTHRIFPSPLVLDMFRVKIVSDRTDRLRPRSLRGLGVTRATANHLTSEFIQLAQLAQRSKKKRQKTPGSMRCQKICKWRNLIGISHLCTDRRYHTWIMYLKNYIFVFLVGDSKHLQIEVIF